MMLAKSILSCFVKHFYLQQHGMYSRVRPSNSDGRFFYVNLHLSFVQLYRFVLLTLTYLL